MAHDGYVGIKQDHGADRLIDSVVLSIAGNTVYRQRVTSVGETLTERMLSKQITEGYRWWVDDKSSALWIYLAEAPAGSDPAAAAVWSGIRVPTAANATEYAYYEAEGFVWDSRASASWTA